MDFPLAWPSSRPVGPDWRPLIHWDPQVTHAHNVLLNFLSLYIDSIIYYNVVFLDPWHHRFFHFFPFRITTRFLIFNFVWHFLGKRNDTLKLDRLDMCYLISKLEVGSFSSLLDVISINLDMKIYSDVLSKRRSRLLSFKKTKCAIEHDL